MDRKELPITLKYPEQTEIQKFHKLNELMHDLPSYEHPEDKKVIKAKIVELQKALEKADDKRGRKLLRKFKPFVETDTPDAPKAPEAPKTKKEKPKEPEKPKEA